MLSFPISFCVILSFFGVVYHVYVGILRHLQRHGSEKVVERSRIWVVSSMWARRQVELAMNANVPLSLAETFSYLPNIPQQSTYWEHFVRQHFGNLSHCLTMLIIWGQLIKRKKYLPHAILILCPMWLSSSPVKMDLPWVVYLPVHCLWLVIGFRCEKLWDSSIKRDLYWVSWGWCPCCFFQLTLMWMIMFLWHVLFRIFLPYTMHLSLSSIFYTIMHWPASTSKNVDFSHDFRKYGVQYEWSN